MNIEPQPTASPPLRPPFQFTLRTLLLLFVVPGSSLAVFGAWGILVFGLVVGLAMYIRAFKSLWSLTNLLVGLCLVVLMAGCLIGLLWPAVSAAPRGPPRSVCQQPS